MKALINLTPKKTLLISLMVPFMMIVLNNAMFNVALPVIRETFSMKADAAAWLAAAYTLPFMFCMPLFGRFGDALGKRTLFLVGIAIFVFGSVLCLLASSIPMVLLGRIIQGVGGGSVHPMCMSIITDNFEHSRQGNALGTWNSIGPITGIVSLGIGGILIDTFGWRVIYIPVFFIGIITFVIIRLKISGGKHNENHFSFRSFDWTGVLLLGCAVTGLVFFTSSRPITGVAPLRDWRIGIVAGVSLVLFIVLQFKRSNPFIDLRIFSQSVFTRASLCVSIRMFTMCAINILIPLYFFDILSFKATSTGIVLMVHAGALLITMRFGGIIADRWTMRFAVVFGLSIQGLAMVCLGLLPAGTGAMVIVLTVLGHGLGAGLSIASLHKAAIGNSTKEESASAAGLYSMVRFAGVLFGTALGGVILQSGFDRGLPMIRAYQISFFFFAGVAFIGVVLAFGLQKKV